MQPAKEAETDPATHYVLIDYENVQPGDLALIEGPTFRIRVFVGPSQTKVSMAVATALQRLGANAEYVQVETAGPNALDFHVAYYMGTITAKNKRAELHVISKDTGYDSLIRHLQGKGFKAHRSGCIAEMLTVKPRPAGTLKIENCGENNPTEAPRQIRLKLPQRPAPTAAADEKLKIAVAHLKNLKTRPKTIKAVKGALGSRFKNELSQDQLSSLIDTMNKRGLLKTEGTKVLAYNLSAAL